MLNPNDYSRIHKFYEDSLREYGADDPRSVHWIDEPSQHARFNILSHVSNFSGKTILDVGCGLGDFYDFLSIQYTNPDVFKYTGIDIIPEFVEQARLRFPTAHFFTKDIHKIPDTESYDIIIASGAMSFKVENNHEYYMNMIKKMYLLTNEVLAFNMLNSSSHINDATFAAYDPGMIADFCKTLLPTPRVEIIIGYLPQDFTVVVFPNNP